MCTSTSSYGFMLILWKYTGSCVYECTFRQNIFYQSRAICLQSNAIAVYSTYIHIFSIQNLKVYIPVASAAVLTMQFSGEASFFPVLLLHFLLPWINKQSKKKLERRTCTAFSLLSVFRHEFGCAVVASYLT